MFIAVVGRRLRPEVTVEDFVRAWYPDRGFGLEGRGPILARDVADEREILTMAIIDLPDRAALGLAMERLADQEAARHDRIERVGRVVARARDLRGADRVRLPQRRDGGARARRQPRPALLAGPAEAICALAGRICGPAAPPSAGTAAGKSTPQRSGTVLLILPAPARRRRHAVTATPRSVDPSLEPDALLAAYARGWFPMDEPGASGPVGLYEAEPRGVMPIEGFRVPRSVARGLRARGLRDPARRRLPAGGRRLRGAPRRADLAHAAPGRGLRAPPRPRRRPQRRGLARRAALRRALRRRARGPLHLRDRCSTALPTRGTRPSWRPPGCSGRRATRSGTSR